MRAYNLSMMWIFICCGFALVDSFEIFGNSFKNEMGIFTNLQVFSIPIFTIPYIDLPVTGVTALAGTMALATVVVLNSNLITDRGVALIAFATLFWGSFSVAILVMTKVDIPGMEMIYGIFLLASTLIFVNAMIQMPTGGQKSHV